MMYRRLALAVVGLIATSAGCMHSVTVPPPECCPLRTSVPTSCRNSVHVFLINGIDPIDAGGLTVLRDYIEGVGYSQTYYAQLYHRCWCERRIHEARKNDPHAKIALIGYDAGAEVAVSLARELAGEGRPTDLLVLIGARDITGSLKPDGRPVALKTVNIRGDDVLIHPPSLPDAANIDVEDSNVLTLATAPATLDVIGRELMALAVQVPIVIEEYGPAPLLVEPAPVPRPGAVPPTEPLPPAWQFLEPRPLLGIQRPVAVSEGDVTAAQAISE